MKTTLLRLCLLGLSLATLAGTVAFVYSATDIVDVSGCQPSFDDEFSNSRIDRNLWDISYKSGRTELQYYDSDALKIEDGVLRIKAEPKPHGNYPYTSGILTTQTTFAQQYGYFEIRARVPKGQGLWPAFWLLHTGPLPWNELDVFEFLGHNPNKVYLYNHWRDAGNNHQSLPKSYTGLDFSQDFHTFALDWKPDSLTWYIDGVRRAQTTQHVPAEPMFMLINLAVGGSWPGAPDATTHFPAYFDIDYVRVYPTNCQSIPAATAATP